jgi:hypothetical protein
MENTNIYKVTHGFQKIIWEKIADGSNSAGPLLSIGFSAISAGVSIYNAYQLAQQKETLNLIAGKLNLMNHKMDSMNRKMDYVSRQIDYVNRKMDYVLVGMEHLKDLTTQVLLTTTQIKDLAYVKMFLDGARDHFEKKLTSGTITSDDFHALDGDLTAALSEVLGSNKDAPIPNHFIEKARSVFAFLRAFNIYLVETHNTLNTHNPSTVRRYQTIEDSGYHYFSEVDTAKDSSKKLAGRMSELRNLHLKIKSDKQPRLKWLSAFTWEVRSVIYTLETSGILSGANSQSILLPAFDQEVITRVTGLKSDMQTG